LLFFSVGSPELGTVHLAADVERRAKGIAAASIGPVASIGPEARKSNWKSAARQRAAIDEFLLLTFDAATTVTWSQPCACLAW
jgi:hypothetical protein